ncbi:MAG: TetR/AcrR family transcriptional regulator [Acidobacteriota bacterium]
MPRTGGEKTRRRILEVAERLFAEKGFSATSVNQIARHARVNKALIYYHFKDKRDLILKLFTSIMDELGQKPHAPADTSPAGDSGPGLKQEMRKELEFLASRGRILSLMLAEALRTADRDDYLFRCAEMVAEREHPGAEETGGKGRRRPGQRGLTREQQRYWVHEFFTGFIPVIAFSALREKWCRYFQADPASVQEHFLDAFESTHVASQLKRPRA